MVSRHEIKSVTSFDCIGKVSIGEAISSIDGVACTSKGNKEGLVRDERGCWIRYVARVGDHRTAHGEEISY